MIQLLPYNVSKFRPHCIVVGAEKNDDQEILQECKEEQGGQIFFFHILHEKKEYRLWQNIRLLHEK